MTTKLLDSPEIQILLNRVRECYCAENEGTRTEVTNPAQ